MKLPIRTNVPAAMGAAMGLPLPCITAKDIDSEIISNERTISACQRANEQLRAQLNPKPLTK